MTAEMSQLLGGRSSNLQEIMTKGGNAMSKEDYERCIHNPFHVKTQEECALEYGLQTERTPESKAEAYERCVHNPFHVKTPEECAEEYEM